MKSYLGIFKMEFKGELQYRSKAISGIFTQFFWGILQILLYAAFMSDGMVDGFSITQMASYIWLGQAFFVMRYITLPNKVGDQIIDGNVCYKFVRPINLYNQWYSEHLGQKIAFTFLRFPIIIIIALFLPAGLGLSMPASALAFVLFLISLFLGCFLSISISMFAVYFIFKTLSTKGAVALVSTISGLLGGMYIPLPLMPDGLQKVLNYLPFRYISDFPFRIYIGNVSINEALIQIGISLAWLLIIIVLGKLLMNRALKKTIIQGG